MKERYINHRQIICIQFLFYLYKFILWWVLNSTVGRTVRRKKNVNINLKKEENFEVGGRRRGFEHKKVNSLEKRLTKYKNDEKRKKKVKAMTTNRGRMKNKNKINFEHCHLHEMSTCDIYTYFLLFGALCSFALLLLYFFLFRCMRFGSFFTSIANLFSHFTFAVATSPMSAMYHSFILFLFSFYFFCFVFVAWSISCSFTQSHIAFSYCFWSLLFIQYSFCPLYGWHLGELHDAYNNIWHPYSRRGKSATKWFKTLDLLLILSPTQYDATHTILFDVTNDAIRSLLKRILIIYLLHAILFLVEHLNQFNIIRKFYFIFFIGFLPPYC